MCSTHNPKKHYFATRQKVCMRFTFVNEDSLNRSFMIDVSQFQEQGSVAIIKAILYLQKKGFNVQRYNVRLPQFDNLLLDFDKNNLIPFQKLPKKQLFFHLEYKQKLQISQQENKKTKQPQRYIGQVIEKVKKWRYISNYQKISLIDAAKIVGIPKKSLDDYYLLLRQGQILNFEFDRNLQNKMGQLRTFIKKHSRKLPTGKLPLQMSNLKCYSLVADSTDIQKDSAQTPIKNNHNAFNFSQLNNFLKYNKIDLDNNCDYFCDNKDSDSD